MAFIVFFLSPKGRISRSQFWLGMLGIAAAMGIAVSIAFWTPIAIASIPVVLIAFVAIYILAIKRLHDCNKTGWWTLVFLWAPGVFDRLGNKVAEESALWWALLVIALVLSLWGLVELGFRRGTDGGNDYGADPLKNDEAPVAS